MSRIFRIKPNALSDEVYLKEYIRRMGLKPGRIDPNSLIDDNFSAQRDFIRDRNPFFAGICTRRAGKSYGGATKLVVDGLETEGCNLGYLALTRMSAKAILWKDCLKVIDRKHGLKSRFNETELTCTLTQSNSTIYLAGADATDEEMEKFLGRKYRTVLIDEAASYRRDLRELVYSVLKPAVADYRGQIGLLGSPRSIKSGLFYDVTNGKEPGWSIHKWTTFDNPHMAENWKEEIEDLKARFPGIEKTPSFRMNYLGEWAIDDSLRVYKFDHQKNALNSLPTQQPEYILGVDLGYSPDPTAFALCALYDTNPRKFVVIKSFKQTGMIISDVAETIKTFIRKYGPMRIIMDAADKQAVEEMRQKHQIPIISADKHGKAGVIEVMNSDWMTGSIQVYEPENADYIQELEDLVWDEREEKRIEDSGCANHLCDAVLYAWRKAFMHSFVETEKKINPHSIEAIEAWENQQDEIIERKKVEDSYDEQYY